MRSKIYYDSIYMIKLFKVKITSDHSRSLINQAYFDKKCKD